MAWRRQLQQAAETDQHIYPRQRLTSSKETKTTDHQLTHWPLKSPGEGRRCQRTRSPEHVIPLQAAACRGIALGRRTMEVHLTSPTFRPTIRPIASPRNDGPAAKHQAPSACRLCPSPPRRVSDSCQSVALRTSDSRDSPSIRHGFRQRSSKTSQHTDSMKHSLQGSTSVGKRAALNLSSTRRRTDFLPSTKHHRLRSRHLLTGHLADVIRPYNALKTPRSTERFQPIPPFASPNLLWRRIPLPEATATIYERADRTNDIHQWPPICLKPQDMGLVAIWIFSRPLAKNAISLFPRFCEGPWLS